MPRFANESIPETTSVQDSPTAGAADAAIELALGGAALATLALALATAAAAAAAATTATVTRRVQRGVRGDVLRTRRILHCDHRSNEECIRFAPSSWAPLSWQLTADELMKGSPTKHTTMQLTRSDSDNLRLGGGGGHVLIPLVEEGEHVSRESHVFTCCGASCRMINTR